MSNGGVYMALSGDDEDPAAKKSRRPRRGRIGGDDDGSVPGWGCGSLVLSTIILAFSVAIFIVLIVHHDHHKSHAQEVWQHIEDTTECDEPCDPTEPVLFWGNNLHNHNYRDCDPIDSSNVDELGLHCFLNVGASTSAKPTVWDGVAYFPTWQNPDDFDAGGHLWAVYVDTCEVKWSRPISYYTEIEGDLARVSPAIDPVAGRYIVLGAGQGVNAGGASLFAVNTADGELRWLEPVDDHPFAVITTSPVIDNDLIWVGISSREESAAAFIPEYPCCSFHGSFVMLSANTGHLLRRFYTATGDVTGNAVWGSTAVVDPIRQRVCYTTGNNYDDGDDETLACEEETDDLDSLRECLIDIGNYVNAFICSDMTGLDLEWVLPVTGTDAWNVACINPSVNPSNCPPEPGPDYDFGQGPMLGEVYNHTAWPTTRQALFAGQKSGIFWAVDYETGEIIWANQVAPGASLGGFEWGSAYHPELGVFAANTNRDYADYVTQSPAWYQGGIVPLNTTTCSGSWVRLDKDTGRVLWQTIDPFGIIGEEECTELREEVFGPMAKRDGNQMPQEEIHAYRDPKTKQWVAVDAATVQQFKNARTQAKRQAPTHKNMVKSAMRAKSTRNGPGHAEGPLAYALGPISVVNDVMFAGSMTGHFYGFDANTGEIKFDYDMGGSYNTAPAVWNGHVATGAGYERFGLGPYQPYFYVFKLGGTNPGPFVV